MRSHQVRTLPANCLQIKALPGNTSGTDVIIGDVHGAIQGLCTVYSALKPDDRFLCVGDLGDKGPRSLEVYQFYHANRDKMHVVIGNHELLNYNTIHALHSCYSILKGFPKTLLDRYIEKIEKRDIYNIYNPFNSLVFQQCILNGGRWLIELYWGEIDKKKISICRYKDGRLLDESDPTVPDDIKPVFSPDSQIKLILECIDAMPGLIFVEGAKKSEKLISPYYVVHADMPCSDAEVQRKLAASEPLSPEQLDYMTWARPRAHQNDIAFTDKGRLPNSVLVYCGHNIILYFSECAVRDLTNTVCLDAKAYGCNAFLVAKHEELAIEVVCAQDTNNLAITNESFEKFKHTIYALAARIQEHLAYQPHLNLYYAAQEGDEASVKFYLEQGADPNRVNPYTQASAVYVAAYNRFIEVADFLIKHGGNPNQAIFATLHAMVRIYEQTAKNLPEDLHKFKVDINACCPLSGETLLTLAIRLGYFACVETLVAQKANLDAPNSYGETALHKAILAEQYPSLNLLLENQADPNLKDSEGDTPLCLGIKEGNIEGCLRLLDDTRTNPNIPDADGKTPLALLSAMIQAADPVDEYDEVVAMEELMDQLIARGARFQPVDSEASAVAAAAAASPTNVLAAGLQFLHLEHRPFVLFSQRLNTPPSDTPADKNEERKNDTFGLD